MKIGTVTLDNNIILAPMAGVTDLPFRLLCKEQGVGMTCTEMVSAKAISFHNKNTEALLETAQQERPVSLQLFVPIQILSARWLRILKIGRLISLIINMGCPSAKGSWKRRGIGAYEESETCS